jgi:hypothetical protein
MQRGSGNSPPRSASSDNCFAVDHDKTGDALTVTLDDNLLDLAQPLCGFYIYNGATD